MKTAMMAVLAACVAVCGWAGPRKTVVVWSEGTAPKEVYPKDINGAIAEGLCASEQLKEWDVVVANPLGRAISAGKAGASAGLDEPLDPLAALPEALQPPLAL